MGYDNYILNTGCSCPTPLSICNYFVSFSDIFADQSNQGDTTEQLVIVLALGGVALITLVVTIATVVVFIMRKRSSSNGDHTKILAPGRLDVGGTHTET